MSRGRRSSASIVANPVLVGAVTTLVIVVAVFLAYNANNGLPFVPTTQLKVQIANGANLVKGNEVRPELLLQLRSIYSNFAPGLDWKLVGREPRGGVDSGRLQQDESGQQDERG